MTTIVAQYRAQSSGGNTVTISSVANPSGADVYVALIGARATPRTVTAISGLGATWTEVHNSGTSRFVVYRGTGGSSSGSITVTFSGTQTATGNAWIVSGAASTVVASFTSAAAGTSLAGPSQSAGNGQAVLASLVATSISAFPSSQTPSGAYTAETNGSASGCASALPTSTANHQVSVTTSAANDLYIGQVVVGDITASGTTVNGSQSTETDSAQAGSTVAGAVVAGTLATEADSATAGSTKVGALVAGTRSGETDTAQAGASSAAAIVAGTRATETDSAGSGSSIAGAVVAGGLATETDAAINGTLGGSTLVGGSTANETDTAQAGTSVVGAVVSGTQSTETDVAQSGSTTTGFVVAGAQVVESDTAEAGTVITVDDGIDLSTFFDIYASTTWTGTALTGSPTYFAFPLVVDPAETYTVEIDYTVTTGTGYVSIHSALGPNDATVDGSSFATLDDEGSLAGTGTSTLTIGPGLGGWDAAMALDEIWPVFSTANVDITAIRVTPAFLAGVYTPPLPPGTVLTREGGRTRTGYAVATWEPAVVSPPSIIFGEHRMIHAAAFGPVTMVGTQPTFTVSQAWTPRARTRILVGGVDVSFFRDVPTPEPEYQLAEPLLWGPSSIEFPQVAAAYETPGVGVLSWCAKGKPVKYQQVDVDGNILSTDYRGIVVAHDLSGKSLRLEVGGHGQGRAALRHKPGPIFRDTLDLGRLAWAAIRDLGLRFEPRLGPTTGIRSALFGNMGFLDYISELCAKAWQRDGTQWSLMPDDSGTYTLTRKDTETVDFTVFNDDARCVLDVRSDAAEEPTTMYASGVTRKGQRVRFGVYPGLITGPAAPYPFADNSVFGLGTFDADTDTGDGITVMLKRLWTAGYLSLEEIDTIGYDADVTRAVMSLQSDAGLSVNGNMNAATWDALFDVGVTGYTTRGSQVEPAAEADNVRRYNRSSAGQVIAKNTAFDPSALRVDRAIDFGSGFSRHQMREWSQAEVSRGQDNWTGTLTIHGGAILTGDVTPGTVIDAANLADVRSIRPGHNVGLPLFAGGILFHVSGVEINRGEDGRPVAVLTVDTQARDAMEVWEIIRRNRETRRDPARRWKGNRASGQIKDSITEWDEIGGVLDGDRELVPGWNRVRVVGGQEGTVSRIKTAVVASGTVNGIEYAIAVFGEPMSPARLTELVPAPLGVDGDKKWRDRSEELEKAGALYSAGTEREPCGYGRQKKGETGAVLTGFHIDDAGFSYRCGSDNLLDVLIWVGEAATISGGRIMRNQLEAGA